MVAGAYQQGGVLGQEIKGLPPSPREAQKLTAGLQDSLRVIA